MPQYVNAEIPFILIGNRRALTDMQILENDWIADFVTCFRHCLEYDPYRCIYILQESETRPHHPTT